MSAVKQIISAAAVAVPFAFGTTMALTVPPAIVVDTTDVTVSADGYCSLPEAIQNANDGARTYKDCGKPHGTVAQIDLTNPGGSMISLTGVLDVTAPVEITGPGSWALEIEQTAPNGHFLVNNTTMTLTGVRLGGSTAVALCHR